MSLRDEIIQKKAAMQLTTERLSRMSGVPRGTINKILNGQTSNPRAWTLFKLAYALGINTNEFSERESGGGTEEHKCISVSLPLYGSGETIRLPEFNFALRENAATYLLVSRRESYESGSRVALKGSGGVSHGYYYHTGSMSTIVFDDPKKPPVYIPGPAGDEIIGVIVAVIKCQ